MPGQLLERAKGAEILNEQGEMVEVEDENRANLAPNQKKRKNMVWMWLSKKVMTLTISDFAKNETLKN